MGAALGAGLGLLLGAGSGYAAQKLQKKHEGEQAIADLMKNNPEAFAKSEHLQGAAKKAGIPQEYIDLISGVGAYKQQQSAGFAKDFGAATGGGQPSPSGQMIAGGGGLQPVSAQGGQPNAPSDPVEDYKQHVAQLDQKIASLQRMQIQYKDNPQESEFLKSTIGEFQKQRDAAQQDLFHHQEHQDTLTQQHQQFEQHMAEMAEFHKENMAMTHAFEVSMAGLHEQNEKDNAFTAQLGTLQNRGSAMADKVSKLAPDQQQAAADRFNREVDQNFRIAKKRGVNVANFGNPDDYKLHLDRKTKSWATGVIGNIAGATGMVDTETGSLEPGADIPPPPPGFK